MRSKLIVVIKIGLLGNCPSSHTCSALLKDMVSISDKEYYKTRIFPYKGKLEQGYFINLSLWVDFLILFLTGLKIIAPTTKLEYKLFPSLPISEYFKF